MSEKKDKKNETTFSPEYHNNVKKAKLRIEKIIMKWFLDDPMMLEAITMFDKIPSKDQKTLGIDTKSRPPCIKYNPNFINGISKEQLEHIMVIEGFKILLKHPTTRLCQPRHISALSSNITITPFTMGSLKEQKEFKDFFPTPDLFNLLDKQCFEEYFRKLMDKQDKVNEQIKQIWNSMSDQEKKELIDNAVKQQQQQQNKDKQENEEEQNGKDGDGFEQFDNEKDALKEHFNPNSTNNKDWGENQMLEHDIKNLVNDNKSSTKKWGSYTGDMFDEILSAHTPKISWKEVIRRFNKSVLSTRTYPSRMKINRRYDLKQPGYRREYDTELICALDSSGSMSNDDIAECLSVINSICNRAKITYMVFDTEIKSIEKKFNKARQNFKIGGRGGTDFQCVVDYADKHKADGLVIFTDGEACEPTKPLKTKVLWLMHSKDRNLKPPCDWGRVAYLDRYE